MARRRSSRSRPRGGSRAGGALLFLVGLLVGAAVLWFFLRERPPEPPRVSETREEGLAPAVNETPRPVAAPRPAVHPSDHVEPEEPTATPVRSVESAEPDAPVRGVRVSLVIDDLGRSLEDVGRLEALGVPVTYAVLPFEEHTAAVVSGLRRARKEMLLHLPMEPKNGAEDPGPGALLLGMSDGELQEKTLAALAAVPGAVGVNNHMGSRLSEDERSMDAVLGVLAGRRNLFFLDSRTSAASVGYKTAIRQGIPAAQRQVFLDGDPSPDAIRTQFQRLLDLARTQGAAIAIGHPHPETLDVLAEEVPRARALGYEFVPVSYLLDRPGDVE